MIFPQDGRSKFIQKVRKIINKRYDLLLNIYADLVKHMPILLLRLIKSIYLLKIGRSFIAKILDF
jgi:hypothetical protein